MLFWVDQCVFLLSVLLRVFLTLFPYCFPVRLFWYFLLVAIFYSKLFCFPRIRLLVCSCVISLYLQVDFFSLFWNVLFCLYCFTQSRYLFNHSSFANTCWFISSCIVIFSSVAFSFLSQRLFPLVLSFLVVLPFPFYPNVFHLFHHFCLLS